MTQQRNSLNIQILPENFSLSSIVRSQDFSQSLTNVTAPNSCIALLLRFRSKRLKKHLPNVIENWKTRLRSFNQKNLSPTLPNSKMNFGKRRIRFAGFGGISGNSTTLGTCLAIKSSVK